MKLNLGCGSDYRRGYVNLDISDQVGADVVHNIEDGRWPFDDETFEEVLAYDILEHVYDFAFVMKELHRVMKVGGVVKIRVPDVIKDPVKAFTDPTHVRYFTEGSFDFFDKTTRRGKQRSYYFDAPFRITRKHHDNGNLCVELVKERKDAES